METNEQGTRGTLLVIDGHSLAFRAFYALPAENFSAKDGQATNAVYGFFTMLSQVIASQKPDLLGVAFDVKGGTFRNKMLTQYKGTREAAPEELISQIPLIQDMLEAFGVTYVTKQGYEGDDVIATLATMGEHADYRTYVLSGDRDAFQLIDDDITVLYPGYHFKELKAMTPQAVEDKYHVTPRQYPDLAALRGETADNIPGVPGVGDGFAAKWINQYGGLDGVIEHADEIKGKKGDALRESIEQIRLNRKVNALVLTSPTSPSAKWIPPRRRSCSTSSTSAHAFEANSSKHSMRGTRASRSRKRPLTLNGSSSKGSLTMGRSTPPNQ